jgi:hypothetical protein
MDHPQPEPFEDFRMSFSYGERNDLNFKFFKGLSDDEVARFLQALLDTLGDAYDTGDIQPLIDAAYEAQLAGYSPVPDAPAPRYVYDSGPLTPLETRARDARVGLMTTSGHFLAGDDPEPFGEMGMNQEQAVARISEFLRDTPVLSEIPSSTVAAELTVRHGGYDIRSVERDPNVAFPIDRLREARNEGRVAALADTYFSFPGATSQGKLRKELPGWIERLDDLDVDLMILIPL